MQFDSEAYSKHYIVQALFKLMGAYEYDTVALTSVGLKVSVPVELNVTLDAAQMPTHITASTSASETMVEKILTFLLIKRSPFCIYIASSHTLSGKGYATI